MSAPPLRAPVSYHGGHSGDFCDHARDTKGVLVERYIECGFTHVGIVEHMPPPRDAFLYDDERALGHDAPFLAERFERYLGDVGPALREEYGDRLHLLVGFETEYYDEAPLARIEAIIERHDPDLVVASVHHVHDVPIDYSAELFERAVAVAGSLDALFAAYFEHQSELIAGLNAVARERPVLLGHFDLIRLFAPSHEPSAESRRQMRDNLEAAIGHGMIVEVNARAFAKGLGEPYPAVSLLPLIREIGGEITLGDDSHGVSDVGLHYDRLIPIVARHFDHVVAFERDGDGLRKVSISLGSGS